jgi:hypothetical protein
LIPILKLLLTPLLITAATLTGRRWGPAVSGWLIGFPLTSGPVSLILALQNGPEFAAQAAIGTLGGQIAVCLFCLVYSLAAQKTNWIASVTLAIFAFGATALFNNSFNLSLLPTFIAVILITCLLIWLIPAATVPPLATRLPAWDIPARMLIATLFVLTLTSISTHLGPQLSGIVAPFPIYGIVLVTFAHHQQGAGAARQFLRGVALGSFAFSGFFLAIALLLPHLFIAWVYLIATLVALLVNGVFLQLSHRN